MSATGLFNVLTEFRFEVGSAVLGANQLRSATDKLSQSADNALLSFQRMGMGLVGQIGLGYGGITSLIFKAVQASEKFNDTQLAFANIIGANREAFDQDVTSFVGRMEHAERIMGKINERAQEFALPVDQLVETTKLLSAILTPKGLAGPDFQTAIDISRGLLKSAPTLGIDPTLVQGQLLRMIEGSASMGDTLFKRLTFETKAFEPFRGGGSSKKFNQLGIAERVETIRMGLLQFGKDTDVLNGQIRSLSRQLNLLKNNLFGYFGALVPLGEVIRETFITLLIRINELIETFGRNIVNNITRILRGAIEQPRETITNLMQVQKLSRDVGRASFGAGIIAVGSILLHLPKILTFFKDIIMQVAPVRGQAAFAAMNRGAVAVSSAASGAAGATARFAKSIFSFRNIMAGIVFVFRAAWVVISRFLPIMFALVGLFQLISRAQAIAKIRDMERLPMILEAFTRTFARVKEVLEPITGAFGTFFDYLAQWLAYLFQTSYWLELVNFGLEGLVSVFRALSTALVLAQAGLAGLLSFIFTAVQDLKDFYTSFGSDKVDFGSWIDAFQGGATEAFKANESFLLRELANQRDRPLQELNMSIGSVTIQQDFKEQQDPDRIAFTIQESLLKMAQNPSQASGRSFAGGNL